MGEVIEQFLETRRLDQGGISRHDNRWPLLVCQRLAAHLNGMPGAQLLLLEHELDVAVTLLQFLANRVGLVPDDDDVSVDPRFFERVEHKMDHRAADDGAQNLGQIAFHAGALAGGEDDYGEGWRCDSHG